MLTGGNIIIWLLGVWNVLYSFHFQFFVVYGYTWLKVVLWTLQVVLFQDKNAADYIRKYIRYWFLYGLSTCVMWTQMQKFWNQYGNSGLIRNQTVIISSKTYALEELWNSNRKMLEGNLKYWYVAKYRVWEDLFLDCSLSVLLWYLQAKCILEKNGDIRDALVKEISML